MPPSLNPRLSLLALGVLTALVAIQTLRLRYSQDAARDLWYRASNLEAQLDTTRSVNTNALKVLGDSVKGVERFAEQMVQERDALDRALKRERKAKGGLTVTVPERDTIIFTPARGQDSVRYAEFALRSVPFTINAQVALPPPPDTGAMNLHIGLDPVRLGFRVGCAPKDEQGLRRAALTVVAPAWARVQIDSMSQEPTICNPPVRHKALKAITIFGIGLLLGGLAWN